MRVRPDLHDIACEFADHVTAGYPCGQPEDLSVRSRFVDRDRNMEQMGIRIGCLDGIMDGLLHIVVSLPVESVYRIGASQCASCSSETWRRLAMSAT